MLSLGFQYFWEDFSKGADQLQHLSGDDVCAIRYLLTLTSWLMQVFLNLLLLFLKSIKTIQIALLFWLLLLYFKYVVSDCYADGDLKATSRTPT